MKAFLKKIAMKFVALLVLSGFISWRGTEYLDPNHLKMDFKISDLLHESAKHEGGDKTSDNGKLKFHKDLPLRREDEHEE